LLIDFTKTPKRNASKAFRRFLNKITKAVFTPSHIYVVEDERELPKFLYALSVPQK
jgi:hypothetical protein